MKEIPLSQGFVALVDDADYDRAVAVGKWSADVRRNAVYATRSIRKATGRYTSIRLHAFITGWPFVDHINGDGLDNRRGNLREASHSTNGFNAGLPAHNTSGRKGVTWDKRSRRWQAQIMVNRRNIFLGQFDDLDDAGRAYDDGARIYHGQFARLNFKQSA